jgi:hypothetical protein
MGAQLSDPFDNPNFVVGGGAAVPESKAGAGLVDPFDNPAFGASAAAPQTQQDTPVTGRGIFNAAATGVAKGTGDLIGLPSDLMSLLMTPMDKGFQWALTKTLAKLGVMTEEQAERLRTLGDDTRHGGGTTDINAAIESVVGGYHKAGNEAEQAAENIARFVPGGALGAGEGQVIKGLVKYGALPGVTSEAAGQVAKGTELEPVARLAGALAPAGVAAAGSKVANVTRPLFNPQAVAEEAAGQSLRSSATNPAALETGIDDAISARAIPGRAPMTTAQELNDPGVLALERSVSRSSPEAVGNFQAQRTAQNDAITSAIKSLVPDITDAQIEAAHAAVTAELAGLGGGAQPEAVGNAVRSVLQKGKDSAVTARSTVVDPLYDAARKSSAAVDTAPVLGHIDDLLKTEKGGIKSAIEEARDNLLVNGTPDTSVPGLMASRKAINSQIDRAKRAGDNEIVRPLMEIRKKLDDALATAPEVGAAKTEFERMSGPVEPFEQGGVGSALEKDQFNKRYDMENSAVPSQFFGRGPGTFEATGELVSTVGKPTAQNALRDTIAEDVMRTAVDASGKVIPSKLAAVIDRYRDSLRHFPELEKKLGDIAGAQAAADRLVKDREFITKFLNSPQLAELDSSGNSFVSAAKLRRFTRDNRADLERLLPPGGMVRLEMIQKELDTINRSVNSKLPGGSDTGQITAGMSVVKNLVMSIMRNAVSPLLAGSVGAVAGGPVGAIAAASVGAAADRAISQALARQTELTNQLLAKALLDPSVAKLLLSKAGARNELLLRRQIDSHVRPLPNAPQAIDPSLRDQGK